jgi:hypothetical protein
MSIEVTLSSHTARRSPMWRHSATGILLPSAVTHSWYWVHWSPQTPAFLLCNWVQFLHKKCSSTQWLLVSECHDYGTRSTLLDAVSSVTWLVKVETTEIFSIRKDTVLRYHYVQYPSFHNKFWIGWPILMKLCMNTMPLEVTPPFYLLTSYYH